MSLIGVIVVLIVVGVLLYLVHTVIPMDARIRVIIDVVVLLAVVLWLLSVFGIMDGSLGQPLRIRR